MIFIERLKKKNMNWKYQYKYQVLTPSLNFEVTIPPLPWKTLSQNSKLQSTPIHDHRENPAKARQKKDLPLRNATFHRVGL